MAKHKSTPAWKCPCQGHQEEGRRSSRRPSAITRTTSGRLRRPTGKIRFKRIVALLSKPGEPLPSDRHERKLLLSEYLTDGSLESSVRIIRALLAYQRVRSLNDNDQAVMHRVQSALLAEWEYVLSTTPAEAQIQLQDLLASASAGTGGNRHV